LNTYNDLYNAIYEENIEKFQSLIKKIKHNKEKLNKALCYSCDEGKISIVKILLSYDNVDPTCYHNYPIRASYAEEHMDIVEFIWTSKSVKSTLQYSEKNFNIFHIDPISKAFQYLNKRDLKQKISEF
jgi:hypothetical protein